MNVNNEYGWKCVGFSKNQRKYVNIYQYSFEFIHKSIKKCDELQYQFIIIIIVLVGKSYDFFFININTLPNKLGRMLDVYNNILSHAG